MKKFLVTFLFAFIAIVGFAQNPQFQHRPGPGQMPRHFVMPHVDMKQYEVVDSLPLDYIDIYNPYDYDNEWIKKVGEGHYVIEMPKKDKMIIRLNADRSKAIVVYNSFVFGRHKEFNIKETERRIVLWYDDDELYCGYAYDKAVKCCKYFETRK